MATISLRATTGAVAAGIQLVRVFLLVCAVLLLGLLLLLLVVLLERGPPLIHQAFAPLLGVLGLLFLGQLLLGCRARRAPPEAAALAALGSRAAASVILGLLLLGQRPGRALEGEALALRREGHLVAGLVELDAAEVHRLRVDGGLTLDAQHRREAVVVEQWHLRLGDRVDEPVTTTLARAESVVEGLGVPDPARAHAGVVGELPQELGRELLGQVVVGLVRRDLLRGLLGDQGGRQEQQRRRQEPDQRPAGGRQVGLAAAMTSCFRGGYARHDMRGGWPRGSRRGDQGWGGSSSLGLVVRSVRS